MNKEKVIVFGAGNYTEKNWNKLNDKYEIALIIDNKVGLNEENVYKNVKMLNPQRVLELYDCPIVIMICDYQMAVEQLIKLGVSESKIRIGISEFCNKENNVIFTYEMIKKLISLPNRPILADWGYHRGTPIGRKYIEKFLYEHRKLIKGTVLEVAETTYTYKYGEDRVEKAVAIHVEGEEDCRKANLETGEGIDDEEFDTMIITQTLAYIYNLQNVVKNIRRGLRGGGYCLITVSDIAHIGEMESQKYGAFWGFHRDGCKRLFSDEFGADNVVVTCYGNIKTVVAQLYGISAEDLQPQDFLVNDTRYTNIIGIVIKKD